MAYVKLITNNEEKHLCSLIEKMVTISSNFMVFFTKLVRNYSCRKECSKYISLKKKDVDCVLISNKKKKNYKTGFKAKVASAIFRSDFIC